MSEKVICVCDSCDYTRTVESLLRARVEAEAHGTKRRHSVRVYVSETRQVGYYDAGRREYEIVSPLS